VTAHHDEQGRCKGFLLGVRVHNAGYLAVIVSIIPPANDAAATMLIAVIAWLNLIGGFALVILLYSLASMLGVFGDKAKQ
jgi:hypothetical protein